MEAIPVRVLRNQPGRFEELLARDGTLILNRDGKPFAIAIGVGESTLEATVRLATQIRAQLAVTELRAQSQARGLDKLTPPEIEEQIRAARSERRE